MQNPRSICALLLLGLLSAGIAFSQAVSASIVGVISDASGAVVATAKVTITETNTGISRAAATNGSGNYTFANLPPGKYSVTVEMPGFKKEMRGPVDVSVDSTARVDVQLQPGNITETIEVITEATTLKTDRADITTTVDTIQISELPNLFTQDGNPCHQPGRPSLTSMTAYPGNFGARHRPGLLRYPNQPISGF
jgi:carboxypeptidase family protein